MACLPRMFLALVSAVILVDTWLLIEEPLDGRPDDPLSCGCAALTVNLTRFWMLGRPGRNDSSKSFDLFSV